MSADGKLIVVGVVDYFVHNSLPRGWVMEDGWAPTGDGMAKFVKMLPAILSKVADAAGALPRVLVTDRGSCFYHGATGHLVKAYQKAVTDEGKPFFFHKRQDE